MEQHTEKKKKKKKKPDQKSEIHIINLIWPLDMIPWCFMLVRTKKTSNEPQKLEKHEESRLTTTWLVQNFWNSPMNQTTMTIFTNNNFKGS